MKNNTIINGEIFANNQGFCNQTTPHYTKITTQK